MRPVSVSVAGSASHNEVYSFLDVLANHERFTNHMLVDWSYAGPSSGVGARAHMRINKTGRPDWIDLEVNRRTADPPRGLHPCRRSRRRPSLPLQARARWDPRVWEGAAPVLPRYRPRPSRAMRPPAV